MRYVYNIRHIAYVAAIIVAVGLVVATGIFLYARHEHRIRFNHLILQAESSYHEYNYDAAIFAASDALSFASTRADIDLAKYYVAASLYNRGNNKDTVASVSLFKAIIADPAASAQLKSSAYIRLGLLYSPSGANSSLNKLVFNGPPYSDYLASANGNMAKATLSLYEKANELYPSAAANYAIAASQAMEIYAQGIDVKDPVQLQLAQAVQRTVANGDSLLTAGSSTLAQLPQIYMLRSFALSTASYYLPSISPQVVDSSYEHALSLMNAASTTISYLRLTAVMLNLTYAASIVEREPGAQSAKIRGLLADFVNESNAFPTLLPQNVLAIRADKPGTPILDAIPKLATLSSPFAAYLTQIGWNK